jgi:hypothetical protein
MHSNLTAGGLLTPLKRVTLAEKRFSDYVTAGLIRPPPVRRE